MAFGLLPLGGDDNSSIHKRSLDSLMGSMSAIIDPLQSCIY
jgi:hypothetical protein